jgi:hypothetical protein
VTQIVPLDVADESAGAALDRRIPLTLLDMNQDFCTSTNEPPTPDGQPLLSLIKKTAYNAELNEDHVHSSGSPLVKGWRRGCFRLVAGGSGL